MVQNGSFYIAIAEESPVVPIYKDLSMSELCDDLQKNLDTNHIMDQITTFVLTDPNVQI